MSFLADSKIYEKVLPGSRTKRDAKGGDDLTVVSKRTKSMASKAKL